MKECREKRDGDTHAEGAEEEGGPEKEPSEREQEKRQSRGLQKQEETIMSRNW